MFSHRIAENAELRLLEERHAEELFSLVDRNRDHLRRWMSWIDDSRGPADTLAYIRRSLERFARNEGFSAGIWLEGRLVSSIGFHNVELRNHKTELGYWIDKAAQGQGLVTRATAALTHHALRELKLNRVEIHCATENRQSRAIPQRLGFTEEGTLRQACWLYDHYVDHVVYSMLAQDRTA